MNRKVTATILTLAVIFSSTAALANDRAAKFQKKGMSEFRQERMKRPPMSDEEKAQFETLQKKEAALRTELAKETIDKEKARVLNKEIVELRAQASAKRFETMLNRGKPKDAPKMTEEQKARMKKMHELSEAIRTELENATPDKTKAKALHNKLLKLRKEAEMERFEYVLQNPKKFNKGHNFRSAPRPEYDF